MAPSLPRRASLLATALALSPWSASSFSCCSSPARSLLTSSRVSPNAASRGLQALKDDHNILDRRNFGEALVRALVMINGVVWTSTTAPAPATAQVFFDPAQYGDQELRVSAVDSVKESVRRAILKKPSLAPSFYQLSLLDGLTFDAATNRYGPDGSILKSVLSTKAGDDYTRNLQEAAFALIEAETVLRRKTAISIADAIAIGGAEAIESIGGPYLTVQLGRADTPKDPLSVNPALPIDLLSGQRPVSEVVEAFQRAGVTEREMTALLGGLLTLEKVEKVRSVDDWKASARPKFREAGKIGRMSEFRPLTDEDFAQAELEEDPEYEDPDDGWYIADSFGTRESRFGERLAKDQISEKSFNKYLQEVNDALKKKQRELPEYGWIASLLLDPAYSSSQAWLTKYASSNLSYLKDLNVAFNSITQLGAVYTGGKYENLLKGRPRKSLNDDGLNLFG